MEEFKIGERLFCIKSFTSMQHNGGKETKVEKGKIYTVREFNQYGHMFFDEVRFVLANGHEGGFANNSDFFISADKLLEE